MGQRKALLFLACCGGIAKCSSWKATILFSAIVCHAAHIVCTCLTAKMHTDTRHSKIFLFTWKHALFVVWMHSTVFTHCSCLMVDCKSYFPGNVSALTFLGVFDYFLFKSRMAQHSNPLSVIQQYMSQNCDSSTSGLGKKLLFRKINSSFFAPLWRHFFTRHHFWTAFAEVHSEQQNLFHLKGSHFDFVFHFFFHSPERSNSPESWPRSWPWVRILFSSGEKLHDLMVVSEKQ